jgi:hypothetical protein
MVLTKPELIAALQNEVRILLHLTAKIELAALDYRPTPSQRSIRELVQYLAMMGPALVLYALANPTDIEIWNDAEQESKAWDFETSLAKIAAHHHEYAFLLENVSDSTFRSEMVDFDGKVTSRGAFIVNLVLCGCAAYRTQLFLYLKASGRSDLNSSNLWSGVDAVPA